MGDGRASGGGGGVDCHNHQPITLNPQPHPLTHHLDNDNESEKCDQKSIFRTVQNISGKSPDGPAWWSLDGEKFRINSLIPHTSWLRVRLD